MHSSSQSVCYLTLSVRLLSTTILWICQNCFILIKILYSQGSFRQLVKVTNKFGLVPTNVELK